MSLINIYGSLLSLTFRALEQDKKKKKKKKKRKTEPNRYWIFMPDADAKSGE